MQGLESLTPEDQGRVRENLERWKQLTPEERHRVRENFEHWKQLSPEERQRVRENLETMSDMAAYVKAGKPTKVAASDEFFNNKDAWPAFAAAYGFDLKPAQRLVLSGGDTAQTEKAVADGTNGVDFGMAYGTDGALSGLGLVVLTDDKGAQPVYWPCPTTRKDVLDRYPEIATILAPAFEKLTLQKLQELNGRIQVGGEAADAVAGDYLKSIGQLK